MTDKEIKRGDFNIIIMKGLKDVEYLHCFYLSLQSIECNIAMKFIRTNLEKWDDTEWKTQI
jgi:hypothetical protein